MRIAAGLLALGALVVLALVGIEAPAASAEATQLRRMTFEAGETPGKGDLQQASAAGRIDVTEETSRLGDAAGVATLLPADPQYRGNRGYRSEWQSAFRAQAGGEYWYGVSYYLPEDWNQGTNREFDDRIIFQFHEGSSGSPTFSLHLDEERERFLVRHRKPDGTFEYLGSAPFEEERWYDLAFHVRWSEDGDGAFRFFVDGRQEGAYAGQTLNEESSVYTKWGIYGQPTRVFFDEVRIVEGADGSLASPAHIAFFLDDVPATGASLARFTGGSNEDLAAAAGCEGFRAWVTEDGALLGYVHGAPAHVNGAWDERFPSGVPEMPLLVACSG